MSITGNPAGIRRAGNYRGGEIMIKCDECGKDFTVAPDEEYPEETSVCYECQREYLLENVPEEFDFPQCGVPQSWWW